jgi:ABC-type multidrug transport system ATPase subunit
LIGNPKLLILDEPSNGIDPEGTAMIRDVIQQQRQSGTAIVVSTNDLPFATALAGRMFRIQEGLLIDS